jgi:hypothetical protein
MTMLFKIWLAAAFATVALHYAIESVEVIKEAVSAQHRDGPGKAERLVAP